MLKIIDDLTDYNDIVVEADDGDGDLRELVAKPLSEHPATCSIVGHLASKLFDQNKRDLWFALSCCSCLWCFCFVYRLSTCLCKCLLFCCLISDRSKLFDRFFLCLVLLFDCLATSGNYTWPSYSPNGKYVAIFTLSVFVCLCSLFHCLSIRWEPLVQ